MAGDEVLPPGVPGIPLGQQGSSSSTDDTMTEERAGRGLSSVKVKDEVRELPSELATRVRFPAPAQGVLAAETVPTPDHGRAAVPRSYQEVA